MTSRKRSLCKTVTWRILASTITGSLVFALTDDTSLSVGVGLLDVAVKLVAYYMHERAWEQKGVCLTYFENYAMQDEVELKGFPSEGDPTEHLRAQEEAIAAAYGGVPACPEDLGMGDVFYEFDESSHEGKIEKAIRAEDKRMYDALLNVKKSVSEKRMKLNGSLERD